MARKTLEQIEETRNSLIEAARLLFLEQGIAQTSLEQIAARVGVTRGAIYSQFPNGKADLLQAIYADLEGKIRKSFINPINLELTGVENLRNFISSWLQTVFERGWLRQKFELTFQAMIHEPSSCEKKKSNFPELAEKAREIIDYAQKNKEISAEYSADLLAVQLVAMFVGYTVIWHYNDWDENLMKQGQSALNAWLQQIIKYNGAKL